MHLSNNTVTEHIAVGAIAVVALVALTISMAYELPPGYTVERQGDDRLYCYTGKVDEVTRKVDAITRHGYEIELTEINGDHAKICVEYD